MFLTKIYASDTLRTLWSRNFRLLPHLAEDVGLFVQHSPDHTIELPSIKLSSTT